MNYYKILNAIKKMESREKKSLDEDEYFALKTEEDKILEWEKGRGLDI